MRTHSRNIDGTNAVITPVPTHINGIRLTAALRSVLANPELVNTLLAEKSLSEFIKQLWKYIDPSFYKHNWHIDVIAEYLEAVTHGQIKRLLINIPPRHMKSIAVSVAWPAWTWLQKQTSPLAGPSVRFLFASYAHSLSVRDSVKCRRLIDSPLYQKRWGERFSMTAYQNTKIRFENDHGGYRLATSVDGALTGEGGDIIVIDDPHNVREKESEAIRQSTAEWWDESMSNRLNDPTDGAYVMIMQRVHHQDLAGHVLERGDWTHLCLPARYETDHPHLSKHDRRTVDGELLWANRFPEAAVLSLERDLGTYGAAGQLQQRPAPRTGGMFDSGWWQYVDKIPSGGRAVRGWDLASSTKKRSPWTVGLRMRRIHGFYYIDDIVRIKGTPAVVEKTIVETAERDGATVEIDLPQDPGQAGKSQIQYLVRQLAGYRVRFGLESGSKELRAEALSAQVEASNVRLLRQDWNRQFVEEAALFPNSDFRDQVDAASRAFHRVARRGTYSRESFNITPLE